MAGDTNKIEQVLGFNVSGALDGLDKLNPRLADANANFEKLIRTLSDFNTRGPDATKNIRSLSVASNTLARSLERLGAIKPVDNVGPKVDTQSVEKAVASVERNLNRMASATSKTAVDVKRNTERMVVSFGLLSRIVFTQAVIRGLRQLTTALEDAASKRIELDRQLGRSQVVDDLGRSVGQLRHEVIELSNAFNIPAAEVAEAQYEVLQRGYKTAAEQLQILDAALKFSKVANVEAAQSVKVLTGTLEAYQLGAEHAHAIASQLFTTIDKGNVTAEELADKLGPVNALAAQMGISFAEVGAALVVMTKQGTGTATALTQLRAILNGLLKPSEDLKQFFDEIGFDTVQVRSLGLAGTLKLLHDRTKGNVEQSARFLRNIRALSGAEQLTSDGLERMITAMGQLEDSQADLINQKAGEVLSNEAEQIAKAGNIIKNTFTQEFGQQVEDIGRAFLEAAGGMDAAKNSATGLAAVAGTLLRALSLPFVGAAKVGNSFRQVIDDITGASEEHQEIVTAVTVALDQMQKVEERLTAQLEADKKILEGYNKSFIDGFGNARAEYNRNVKLIESASRGMVAGVKSQLDRVRAAFRDVSNAAEQVGERIHAIQNETRQAIHTIDSDIRRLNVDRLLDRATTPQQKLGIVLRESNDLLIEGTRQLREAGLDAQKRAEAIAKLQLSKEYAEQAAAIARSSDDIDLQRHATSFLVKNAEGYKNALIAADNAIKSQRPRLEAMANDLVGLGPRADELIRRITERIGLLRNNQLLSKDQVAQFRQEIEEAVNELVQLGAKISPEFLKQLGFNPQKIAQIISQVRVQAKEVPLKAIVETERLQAQLDKFFQNYRASVQVRTGIDIQGLEKHLKINLDNPTALQTAVQDAVKQYAKVNDELTRAEVTQARLNRLINSFVVTLDERAAKIPDRLQLSNPTGGRNAEFLELTETKKAAQEVIALFRQMQLPENLTPENLNKADVALANFQNKLKSIGEVGQRAFRPFTEALNTLIDGLLRGGDPAAQRGNPAQMLLGPERLKELKDQRDTLREILNLASNASPNIGPPLQDGGKALSTGANDLSSVGVVASATIATNLHGAASSLTIAADALQRAATVSIPAPVASATEPGSWFGRPSYFKHGGFARGQDRHLVAVADGEGIMNQRATQRFFSQIQAMNAGKAPVMPTTSQTITQVGDIHMVVNGGPTNPITARALLSEIRREIKRGTSRL